MTNFITAIQGSLRVGVIHNSRFSVHFRSDVFRFLFSGKGTVVSGRRGRHYVEDDFDPHYFQPGWWVCYDKLGNGCKVSFPICMYHYVKFTPAVFCKNDNGLVVPRARDFDELLVVSVAKSCCY